jgi:hypothetical protein
MHATDANEMSPQQRLDEIAHILAGGFLRLRRHPGYVPDAENRGVHPAENSFSPTPELTGCPANSSA